MDQSEFIKRIKAVSIPLPGSQPYDCERYFSVKGKYDHTTLIDFLADYLPTLSRQDWLDKITTGLLKVNGICMAPDAVMRSGYRLLNIDQDYVEPHISTDFKLVYNDASMMIVHKPAPIPMHACGRFNRNTLINILEMAFPKEDLKIVHRLDADTTGLVVLAKASKNAAILAKAFQQLEMKKEYLALVEGIVEESEFSINKTIGRDTTAGGARNLDGNGLTANTDCRILKTYPELKRTLLSVSPRTGRTNQIRLHLSSNGFPLVGDHGYKNKEGLHHTPLTMTENLLCLHAYKLTFCHPATGKEMTISTPPPDWCEWSPEK